MSLEEEQEILHSLETPGQLETPVKKFKLTEARSAINQLRTKKAPGQDLITGNLKGATRYQNKSCHPNI